MSRDESFVTDAVLSDPKPWNCLRVVDLSYNDLMEIDQSMVSVHRCSMCVCVSVEPSSLRYGKYACKTP